MYLSVANERNSGQIVPKTISFIFLSFIGIIIHESKIYICLDIRGCVFTGGAFLQGAFLQRCVFIGCGMRGVRFYRVRNQGGAFLQRCGNIGQPTRPVLVIQFNTDVTELPAAMTRHRVSFFQGNRCNTYLPGWLSFLTTTPPL